jgi:hypothetical protein
VAYPGQGRSVNANVIGERDGGVTEKIAALADKYAQEWAFEGHKYNPAPFLKDLLDLVEAEREACAEIADEHEVCNRYCHVHAPGDTDYACHWNIAKAIRARGEA